MKFLLFAILIFELAAHTSWAQDASMPPPSFSRDGRWAIGFRAGGNVWFNDFDTRKIAGSGDFFLRYAFSRKFSLGILGAYEALQANESPAGILDAGGPGPAIPNKTIIPIRYAYVEAKGYSGDLVAWFHFFGQGKFSPYVYIGIGGARYQRRVNDQQLYPGDDKVTTYHIPAGFGFDIMFNKNVGLNLDFGARVTNDLVDAWKGNKTNKATVGVMDWHGTGRAGLNFYLGRGDNDDDDGDGLTSGEEEGIGTDPNIADTDGDGLNDGEEYNIYKTDPLKADTDSDGLNDGAEIKIHQTDPANRDTDGDGLSDGDEVGKFGTAATKADSDGDGLSDGDEVMNRNTNPLNADTDGDTLSDGDEVGRKTDPTKADTDGGSVNDGQEVANNTNPLNASDDVPKQAPVEVGKSIVLEGIVFRTGSARIDPKSEGTLMLTLTTLRDNPEIAVEIRGYTDNVGGRALNMKLAMERAKEVRWWLLKKGIEGSRMIANGYGPDNPVTSNATAEGRQKNRRIEFYRTK